MPISLKSKMARFAPNPNFRRRMEQDVFAYAIAEATEALSKSFDQVMNDSIWFWPNQTTRSTGEVVTSPRNIRDTGYLINSKVVNQVSALRWVVAWQASYAVIVLLGFQGVAGNSMPGRDWVSAGIDEINVAEVFAKSLRKILVKK